MTNIIFKNLSKIALTIFFTLLVPAISISSAVFPNDLGFVGEIKITASDGETDSGFGYSVAVSGDTAIVGAVAANFGKGAAYIFVKDAKGWTQQQKLTASDRENNDFFGRSVAISGNTAIVGASGDDLATGSAYIFVKNGTTWTQQQKLTASDANSGSFFGWSVGIEDNTAVVGAYNGPSTDGEPSGAAYIFFRSGTIWNQQQKLATLDGEEGRYGESVGISGETVIVSSPLSDVGGNQSQGAAYIYVRNGTVWSQQQKISSSDGTGSDNFGDSVGISGDTVIVGTVSRNAAYVFSRNGTNWTQQQKLTPAGGGSFGSRVAISGDSAFVTNYASESVYYFARSGTIWSEEQIIVASDGVPNDFFGSGLAINGKTLIVGALGDNSYRGAAYIYSMPSITVNITTDESDPTPTDGVCDVDSGTSGEQCSLQAAIETANANSGSDSIKFNIPGGGIHAIAPLSELPFITGAVNIDATTQTGYVNSPMIELQGTMAGENTIGLGFASGSDGSAILGLAINRFSGGIVFSSSDNRVEKCYLGIDANGSAVGTIEQQLAGIGIGNGSNNNTIGGVDSGSGNVISNNSIGVSISGTAEENKILGNKIGTNVAGNLAIPNIVGVVVEATGNNIIGDETGVNGNLISGNLSVGIILQSNASNTTIVGNLIGTKANGTEVLPNEQHGIFVDDGANNNSIGNETTAGRNIIGGHNLSDQTAGIVFAPDAGSNNRVVGNLIGVARDEQTALPNKYGIAIFADGQNIGSQMGKNIIGFNEKSGIWIIAAPDSTNTFTEGNSIQYNFIGTNGTADLGNGQAGIRIEGNAINNNVTRNFVAGNEIVGIFVFAGANANNISLNFVGTDESGNSAIQNSIGIWIREASDNTVSLNLVSGNFVGILIGEDIGVLETANFVERLNEGSNFNTGIVRYTSGNQVSGNRVGLNNAGNAAIPNAVGIAVGENARNNFIGSTSGTYNLVSGNTSSIGYGILLGTVRANPAEDRLPQLNTFQGNVVGLAGNLQTTISNTIGFGLLQAKNNLIGGNTDLLANVIVASTQEGLSIKDGSRENTFLKNYVGTLPPGFGSLSKGKQEYSQLSTLFGNGGDGIFITNGSSQNTLGGTNTNSGLVIANNGGNGILLSSTAGNGNRIGTNSIFGNTGNSVDLGGDGFTPNDLHDDDIGPNNLQNYPDLAAYQINGKGDLIVSFSVDSAPENSVYGTNGIRAEFFKADASGEGERFLGFANYTVADYNNGSPNVINANLGNAASLGFNLGDPLTATSTDADGNSSEFTPAFTLPVAFFSVSGRVFSSDGFGLPRAIVVMTNSNGIQRIAQSNSFGYYRFEDVPSGMTYTFSIESKEHSFTPQVVNVQNNITNLNFTAQTKDGKD